MAARNAHPHGGPRKGRSAANALATTVAVVVSLLLANVVGTRLFARADLTEDGKLGRLPDRRDAGRSQAGSLQSFRHHEVVPQVDQQTLIAHLDHGLHVQPLVNDTHLD